MARWKIENTLTGEDLGRYSAETRQGALEVFAREAGYKSYAELTQNYPVKDGEIRVTKISGTK